tara:strand:+ start:1698 stop:2195 length:498 start_codon:yes stop_codon:yes gene_type:complete
MHANASSEVVYKTIGDDGVPTFSDKIKGEHERVFLSKSNRTNIFKSSQSKVFDVQENETKQLYRVEILSPRIKYTFRNNEKVPVGINVRPRFASGSGHQIRVFLDGNLLSEYGSSLNFQIVDIERGAHTLEVVLIDMSGQELARSEARTFFVQKASIFNRNRSGN